MIKKIARYISEKRSIRLAKRLSPRFLFGYNQRGEFLKDTRIGSTTTMIGKEGLTLEDNVFIGQYSFIEATNGMLIEEGCQIGYYVTVVTHSSHLAIRLYGDQYRKTTNHVAYQKNKVRIGKYTFVGPYSTIMPGSNIGKGCLVSAYSMVTGKIPDFSIVAGNPAKVIGDTRKIDEALLRKYPELRESYDRWAKD